MQVSLAELNEFPNFTECTRLVRRALERKSQRLGAGKGAAAAADDDALTSAAARADAAMVPLQAERP